MFNLLSDHSHLEVSAKIQAGSVALWPIGSQEQHGYLPTGIDNLLAEGYAQLFAEYLQESSIDSLILPTLNYGYTPICQGYAGSVSLSKATFQRVVTEVLTELVTQGFKKIVIVNGHRDNQSAIDEVVTTLSKQFGEVQIVNPVYAWLRTTDEFTKKYPDRDIPEPVKAMDGFVQKVGLLRHADAAEMSLFYAVYPEKQAEYEQKLANKTLPDLHSQLPATHEEWAIITKPNEGGAGDPRGVDIAAAKVVIETMCQQLLKGLT